DLHYEYGIYTAQRTETDNKAQTVGLSYIVPLSLVRRVQVNVDYSDVNYDSSDAIDYRRKGAHLQFVNDGDEFEINSSIGYIVLDPASPADDISGVTGDAHVTWKLTGVSSLFASYVHTIEEQTNSNLTVNVPQAGTPAPPGTVNSGVTPPYTLDSLIVG